MIKAARATALPLLLALTSGTLGQDWNVSTAGTRTSCTNGNGDWTAAQTYGTAAAVFNTCASSLAAGDRIVFDDGVYSSSGIACSPNLNVTGEITFVSRKADSTKVTLEATSPTAAALSLGCTNGNNDFVFEDVTLTKSVAHTATALPFFYIFNEARHLTFRRSPIIGLVASIAGNNSSLSGPILSRFNGTRTSRTITFDSVTMRDFSLTYENGSPFILWAPSGTSVVLSGTNTIDRISYESTGSDGSDGSQGGFYIQSGASLSVSGTVNASNVTSEVQVGNQNYGLFRVVHTGTATLASGAEINCTDFNFYGGEPPAACFYTSGAFSMLDGWVTGERITVTEDPGGNNNGAVFIAAGSSAQGKAKVRCIESESKTGAALYAGSGGGGRFLVDAQKCRSTTGVVYSGGDGDFTLGGVIWGSSGRAGEAIVSSLDVYSQINTTTSTRNKTTNLYGLTIGPDRSTQDIPSVYVTNGDATYTHTLNLYNTGFGSGAPTALIVEEGASATMDVTGRKNGVPTGSSIDTTDVVNGSVSITGTVTGAPKWVGGASPNTTNGFRLLATSPWVRAGDCYLPTGCAYPDLNNRRSNTPPDIGGHRRSAGD